MQSIALFTPDVSRLFVLSQSNELRMPQMGVRCPLDELELTDQFGFNPHAFTHLLRSDALTPAAGPLLWQIHKWARCDSLDLLEPLENLFA
jgi:hypothetical protein